jgi:hypothetical protein
MTTTWGTEIPKPPSDPDEVAFLVERSVRLKALTEHPAWAELRLVMEERRDVHMHALAKRLMRGNVDATEIDRHTGFWQGVFAVLDKPDEVEKDLVRKLRRLDTADDSAQEGET